MSKSFFTDVRGINEIALCREDGTFSGKVIMIRSCPIPSSPSSKATMTRVWNEFKKKEAWLNFVAERFPEFRSEKKWTPAQWAGEQI